MEYLTCEEYEILELEVEKKLSKLNSKYSTLFVCIFEERSILNVSVDTYEAPYESWRDAYDSICEILDGINLKIGNKVFTLKEHDFEVHESVSVSFKINFN